MFFGHVEHRLNWKGKVNFNFFDIATWETNYSNTHIAQYLKKYRQSDTFQLIEYSIRSIFLERPFANCDGEIISKTFPKR